MVTFPPPTLLPSGCAPERPQKNLTLHTSITGNLPRESAYTGLSFLLLLPHSPERGFRRKNSYIIKLSVPFLKKRVATLETRNSTTHLQSWWSGGRETKQVTLASFKQCFHKGYIYSTQCIQDHQGSSCFKTGLYSFIVHFWDPHSHHYNASCTQVSLITFLWMWAGYRLWEMRCL